MSETPTPSEPGSTRSGGNGSVAAAVRAGRRAVLERADLRGAELCGPLSELADRYFADRAGDLPVGFALAATAGYARRELCPASDVDVLLLHDKGVPDTTVTAVAERLWYPLWDAGVKVSPGTHTVATALDLAAGDLVTATTLLDVRHLAGDARLTDEVTGRARDQWRKRSRRWLRALRDATEQRHAKAGEVAFLLEPDLKEGRGGIRDVQGLVWALATADPAVDGALEVPVDVLRDAGLVLLGARAELHRTTGRVGDRLLLQEQDAVAAALGYDDADALMAAVAAAARTVAWHGDHFWRRVEVRTERRPWWRSRDRVRLAPDLWLAEGEVVLDDAAPVSGDATVALRVAAAAAQTATLPAPETLRRLAAEAPGPGDPWPDDARESLLTTLGAGLDAIPVWEALDQYGLLARVLPEWEAVRSRPQRNAYHRYTVDRHLCQTAAAAVPLVRRVARPDLLLVAAWLHDIGKGYPGDHTDAGTELVARIATRLGFAEADVATLVLLVEHHLLLPETATRRDISDPGTIGVVAAAARDGDHLDLLHALTEADSVATGPTAWSEWKASLLRQLVASTHRVLAGHRPPPPGGDAATRYGALMAQVRGDGKVRVEPGARTDGTAPVVVAAPDRPGLFSAIAGVFSLHGVDVRSADVWTSDDGIAVDEFRVARRLGGETNWRRVEHDMEAVLSDCLDLEAKLADKVRSYGRTARNPTAAQPPRAEVLVDNTISSQDTVIEIRAPDGLAVLHRVTAVLARFGLDIRHAKVATLGHEVVDAFYVRRLVAGGSPARLDDADEIEALRRALLAELDRSGAGGK